MYVLLNIYYIYYMTAQLFITYIIRLLSIYYIYHLSAPIILFVGHRLGRMDV